MLERWDLSLGVDSKQDRALQDMLENTAWFSLEPTGKPLKGHG